MSALLQAPDNDVEQNVGVDEQKLVAAVRRGDDRAFEALYERYHRRIHAYVLGMVKDHQRAEDVTQEVFVSALRRMRATERPIAFKPWVYEIAKNACIDQFRRSRRSEEISMDADDGLAPSDYGRLVSPEPVPDAALAAKQQLDDLCGAFGGLSEAHHQILVLRELEGLSYREIGERMGMSRPAVESTLFRARRRLTEEYDQLASGQRCLRIQDIIATAGSGRLGARDTRRLARHVAHCQPCRRHAVAAGVDATLPARKPITRRAADKVAALFFFPVVLRGRRGGSGDAWLSQLPAVSDHAAAGTAKLAAVAAIVVAGLGAGVGSQLAPAHPDHAPAAPPAATTGAKPAAAETSSAHGATSPAVSGVRRGAARSGKAGGRGRDLLHEPRPGARPRSRTAPAARRDSGSDAPATGGGGGGAATGVGTQDTSAPRAVTRQAAGGAGTPAGTGMAGAGGGSRSLPALRLPGGGTSSPPHTVDPVQEADTVVGAVEKTTQDAAGAIQQATSGATTQGAGAVDAVTDALPGSG